MKRKSRGQSPTFGEAETRFVRFDAPRALALCGDYCIENATSIHGELVAILATAPAELVIDMSGITGLDPAGLQLLLALRRAAATTRVHSCPATLREYIERVGLTQVLT